MESSTYNTEHTLGPGAGAQTMTCRKVVRETHLWSERGKGCCSVSELFSSERHRGSSRMKSRRWVGLDRRPEKKHLQTNFVKKIAISSTSVFFSCRPNTTLRAYELDRKQTFH